MQMALPKNAARVCLSANIVLLCAVSHFVAKRRKINNPQNLKVFPVVYFIGRLILDNADGIA
ncbi:hypothetical protein [Treponema pedis]|uniref:hypothetical protein n=1 Tax=Treponema pedis TaxID=409322 RepID=UPI0004216450|nr:hypothetical protein [Treponema pedis]